MYVFSGYMIVQVKMCIRLFRHFGIGEVILYMFGSVFVDDFLPCQILIIIKSPCGKDFSNRPHSKFQYKIG